MTIYTHRTIDEYAAFLDRNAHWNNEIVQLSKGWLNFRVQQIGLPGVLLEWNDVGGSAQMYEDYQGDGIAIGLPLDGDGPNLYRGAEVADRHMVVWKSSQDQFYVFPANVKSLFIYIESHIVKVMGWELDANLCKVVDKASRQRLISVCQLFRQRMDDPGHAGDQATGDTKYWRDQILSSLEILLKPWFKQSALPPIKPKLYASLTLGALRAMQHQSPDGNLDIGEFAAELGVSRRTLFRAFRKSLGLGPYTYLRILRLNQLRERLKSGHPETDTIFRLAHECGFNNMGHLTAFYKAHFNELPSETLRRTVF